MCITILWLWWWCADENEIVWVIFTSFLPSILWCFILFILWRWKKAKQSVGSFAKMLYLRCYSHRTCIYRLLNWTKRVNSVWHQYLNKLFLLLALVLSHFCSVIFFFRWTTTCSIVRNKWTEKKTFMYVSWVTIVYPVTVWKCADIVSFSPHFCFKNLSIGYFFSSVPSILTLLSFNLSIAFTPCPLAIFLFDNFIIFFFW